MKKFLLSLLLGLSVGVVSTHAETITITPNDVTGLSGTSYGSTTITVSNVTFSAKNIISTGQIRVNRTGSESFNLYNSTAISGIKTVTLTASASTLGKWHMKTSSTAEVTESATTNDIAGVTTGSKVTFTVPDGTDASFFHINLTTKGSGTVKFTTIEIEYSSGSVDPIDPEALANLVIKYGDDVTVSENDAVSVTEGTTFEISADNAESITISGLNGKLMSVPTNTCIWTPEAMEEDLITVTATKGEQTLETMFTLVVTAPDTRVDANLSFAEATVNHDINDAFTAQQLTNPENLTVTWSSSNDKVASIDATSGDITINATGTTTIRADFAGDDAFKPGSAEYTLVVADRNVQIVTFDFINADYGMVRHTAGTDYNPDPITFGNGWIGIKATGRNRLWSTKGLRVYEKATVTIYAPEGCALTEVCVLNADGTVNTARNHFTINETKTEATYTHTPTSNSDLAQIKITYTGATDEELAAAFQAGSSLSLTIENAEYAEGTCVKSSEADAKVSIANVYPHAKIYYSWTADAAEAATFAEAGYEEYTAPLSLDRAGQLNYYAELNGQRTAVQTLTVTGPTTTGISEIEATGATSIEWFDLSGRRVAAPAKGVYLRKQGAKVTKIAY